jgi:DNA-binding response OmpR family regulator
MHALVIEDSALLALAIEDELRELGYLSFDHSTSEEEAVAAAQRRCPDLITADNRLLNGSGIEAVKRICAERVIPVVFIVGEPADVSIMLPDATILEKPFSSDQLLAAVRQVREASSPTKVIPGAAG